MASSVADAVVETLIQFGVKRVYGIPGDSLNPIIDSIRRHDEIQFIQTRHEEGAALEAAFEAKVTGKTTVCMGTSGPGSIHLLNGLYEAKMDHVPVLALTGQVETDLIGTEYFQEVNLSRIFQDVSFYSEELRNPDSAQKIVEIAYRTSYISRGVSHIIMPADVLRLPCKINKVNTIFPIPEYDFDPAPVNDLINKSSRPIVFIGNGTRGLGNEITAFAKKIGAPVIYALNAKGTVDDLDPAVLGTLGLLGTRPSVEAMKKCDLLILIGTSFPYTQFFNDDVKIIQVDTNPVNLGKRYHADVQITASAEKFIKKINPAEKSEKFYQSLEKSKKDWMDRMHSDEQSSGNGISPEHVASQVVSLAPADAIIVVDTGNVTVWGVRNTHVGSDRKFLFSPWLGSMGVGIPGCIGASFGSDKMVVGIIGDGSFAMTMMELITAKKYNRNIKLVVFNNSLLGMIKFEEAVMGYPPFGVDLYNPDFSKVAEAVGIQGFRVEKKEDFQQTLEKFMATDGPAVMDVLVDPDEKPMPPRLTFSQAKGYVTSILREQLSLK